MKKFLVVGSVLSSLALASCGVTASLNQAVSSLGASSTLQIHLTASASGTQSAQTEKILNLLSFDLNYSSPSGSPLSQVKGNANADVIVNVGSQQLVDLRSVGSNVYALVNMSALSSIPSINVSPTEISALQLLLGGRWFEFPASLLAQYATQNGAVAPSSATKMKYKAAELKAINVLTAVIEAAPYTTLPNGGYEQTGTLESLLKAELPVINGLSGTTTQLSNVKGTYSITMAMSGSSVTGGSIGITAPNGTSGNQTVTLNATVAHASDDIVAPTNVTVISASFLKSLLTGVSTSGA